MARTFVETTYTVPPADGEIGEAPLIKVYHRLMKADLMTDELAEALNVLMAKEVAAVVALRGYGKQWPDGIDIYSVTFREATGQDEMAARMKHGGNLVGINSALIDRTLVCFNRSPYAEVPDCDAAKAWTHEEVKPDKRTFRSIDQFRRTLEMLSVAFDATNEVTIKELETFRRTAVISG